MIYRKILWHQWQLGYRRRDESKSSFKVFIPTTFWATFLGKCTLSWTVFVKHLASSSHSSQRKKQEIEKHVVWCPCFTPSAQTIKKKILHHAAKHWSPGILSSKPFEILWMVMDLFVSLRVHHHCIKFLDINNSPVGSCFNRSLQERKGKEYLW